MHQNQKENSDMTTENSNKREEARIVYSHPKPGERVVGLEIPGMSRRIVDGEEACLASLKIVSVPRSKMRNQKFPG